MIRELQLAHLLLEKRIPDYQTRRHLIFTGYKNLSPTEKAMLPLRGLLYDALRRRGTFYKHIEAIVMGTGFQNQVFLKPQQPNFKYPTVKMEL